MNPANHYVLLQRLCFGYTHLLSLGEWQLWRRPSQSKRLTRVWEEVRNISDCRIHPSLTSDNDPCNEFVIFSWS